MNHDVFMKQALALAEKAHVCDTLPNPRVGAVIVKDNRVISTGYHKRCGAVHAERDALDKLALAHTQGATLYCTLEPCCGMWDGKRQSPCVDAIIHSGIARVYIASIDPNPKVCGQGIQALRMRNIDVEVLSRYTQAQRILNEAVYALYASAHYKEKTLYTRPFVHAKIAQSLDARIAAEDGSSAWISNTHAQKKVHAMRSETHMICTGVSTIIKDNPRYSVRHVRGTSPALAIFDSMLRTPPTANALSQKRKNPSVVIFTTEAGYDNKTARKALEHVGAHILCVNASHHAHENDKEQVSIAKAMSYCIEHGIYTIMLEAGARLTTSFLTLGFVDKLSFFIAPLFLGGRTSSQRYTLWASERTPSMDEAMHLFYAQAHAIEGDVSQNANCLLTGYTHDIFSSCGKKALHEGKIHT